MENKQTPVEWSEEQFNNPNIPTNTFSQVLFNQAKEMERENASTFGIRVTSECCSIKNGKMEVDLHKFETLLNDMYGE